jgi:hypothetical protein
MNIKANYIYETADKSFMEYAGCGVQLSTLLSNSSRINEKDTRQCGKNTQTSAGDA